MLAATVFVIGLLALGEGNPIRQFGVLAWVLTVPGASMMLRSRDQRSSIFAAQNVMMVVPLSFLVGVGGSLVGIYAGVWSAYVFFGGCVVAVVVSAAWDVARCRGVRT